MCLRLFPIWRRTGGATGQGAHHNLERARDLERVHRADAHLDVPHLGRCERRSRSASGAGRAFSAGGNVIAMQRKIDDPDAWDAGMPEARWIVFRMLECDKPIIARVNGHAVGLGATIALLCDIIIAADHAKIADPHVNAGLVAGDGGALIWPQLIGLARAKEYLFTGA